MYSLIFRSIGIIILIFILRSLNISELLNIIADLDKVYFLIALFLSIPFFAIKIWRWKFILYRIALSTSKLKVLTRPSNISGLPLQLREDICIFCDPED